jgi:hypothetical protein
VGGWSGGMVGLVGRRLWGGVLVGWGGCRWGCGGGWVGEFNFFLEVAEDLSVWFIHEQSPL